MDRRKAGARHRIGQRLADVREEHRRAVDRDDLLQMLGRHAADREEPGLRRLDEEERLVGDLRRQRHRQHALVDVGLDLLAARAKAHLDLRLLLVQERLRRAGALEREVLEIDLVDAERGALGTAALLLRVGHDVDPWRCQTADFTLPPAGRLRGTRRA